MEGPTFQLSEFQKLRQNFVPVLPHGLQKPNSTFEYRELPVLEDIRNAYPAISNIKYVEMLPSDEEPTDVASPLRVGVVLSGGQAPGGHNVIMGVYDYIKRHHPSSQLFGFLGGPKGIITNKFVEITDAFMMAYRNQGGFDMICSGRDKIEKPEDYESSLKNCQALDLNGLVVIGGDDSNTNAALLADYFLKNGCPIQVIGCPKTIDGDLKNEYIEVSFGFDTATRTYSESIGNVCLDAISTKKYYHFIRVMGRSASHIALECQLLTRTNLVLIGEEVREKQQTLQQLTDQLADMIMNRAALGKAYGVVIIPEGLIEFIPELNALFGELNDFLSSEANSDAIKNSSLDELEALVSANLSEHSKEVFCSLPESIRRQLLLDRDPHGNVQVAKIDTERLFMLMLEPELAKRNYPYPFLPQSYYFGYEGRACLPTDFDATYCYALGSTAGALIKYGFTGCMAVCRDLHLPPAEWKSAGCPLATMMNMERRHGKSVAVIKKALVEMDAPMFTAYERVREHWMMNDCYQPPGPVQFAGAPALSFMITPPNGDDLMSEPENPNVTSPYFRRGQHHLSPLGHQRIAELPELPRVFQSSRGDNLYHVEAGEILDPATEETRTAVHEQYPHLCQHKRFVQVVEGNDVDSAPLRIGVACLGRHAPGAHNVIDGLLRVLKTRPGSVLFGFLGGSKGLLTEDYFIITEENFALYRNTGGIDFLGRTADGIRGSQRDKVKKTCNSLTLDGLVLLGATHSLTDAGALADYFLANNVATKVVGIPCTIDGNIAHSFLESTLGFDTASRVNSQLIGNMLTDAASATKYFYFIRVMGRDPSHLVMESGIQTHANAVLISELFKREAMTLDGIVEYIGDIVHQRSEKGKQFGAVLIPEGLLVQLPHFKQLFNEISAVMRGKSKPEILSAAKELAGNEVAINGTFHQFTAPVLKSLPTWFQFQLLTRIDTNGNVLMSLVETERLLAEKVSELLSHRKRAGVFKGAFSPVCHFFGYQGRCSFPSILDCSLGSTFGATAGALIGAGLTGYVTTARGLTGAPGKWRVGAIPVTAIMKVKGCSAYGQNKAVVPSADVDLNGAVYDHLAKESRSWVFGDHFSNPGPIQFSGEAKDIVNLSLQLAHSNYLELLDTINGLCARIQNSCRFGVSEDLMRTASLGLTTVEEILKLHKNL